MYFPKLDSIRCFAAFAVVFAHIFQVWTWDPATVNIFPLGNVGVVVFFVLSGFLITRLLLDEPVGLPLSVSFKNFYMRRTLRIFPIYYLYLIVISSIGLDEIRSAGFYPWTYLTNFFLFKNDQWLFSNSPLWSLSVEEQFYLVWPFIVLFLREKMRVLTAIFIGICALSIAVRLYLFLHGYSTSPQIEVFTFANLDYLAIGGLLALAYKSYGEKISRAGLPILIGGLVVYFLCVQLTDQPPAIAAVYWTFGKFSVALAATGLVLYSLHSNPRYTLLHNPVTIHLGKISYGVYLFHNPLVSRYREISGAVGLNPAANVVYDPSTNMISDLTVGWEHKILAVIVILVLILAVAEFSYWFIERPLLRLKDRFRSKPKEIKDTAVA